MAGLAIEVKCKDAKAYRLGGVQKIEFEQHKVDEDVFFDYISTTIFDTRRYAFESVEYIKVFGGAAPRISEELRFILKFAEENDFGYEVTRKQLRSLWTAYCLHNNYECDTLPYDTNLSQVWKVLDENTSCPWVDDEEEGIIGFELFDMYMCEEVV